ncbi:excalibur calcium-binding domain-containing protein [Pseudoalteromonas sp. MT33b]|nr:calcium-binding protein [Pseudoalteromonas sp.]QMW16612.1 excalibur calcium-binding domain-containing protein [Pseudoalteromonas sp. MT33b]|tara:strand:+ start:296 stop:634 length:339 start_codon:yes stop_codon:yes gene_type:complete
MTILKGSHVRKLLLLIIIGLFGWEYYAKNYGGISPIDTLQSEVIDPIRTKYTRKRNGPYLTDESKFVCDGRQYCSEMTSLEEALFFIKNCPNTDMDGDYDGDPCENDTRLRP